MAQLTIVATFKVLIKFYGRQRVTVEIVDL